MVFEVVAIALPVSALLALVVIAALVSFCPPEKKTPNPSVNNAPSRPININGDPQPGDVRSLQINSVAFSQAGGRESTQSAVPVRFLDTPKENPYVNDIRREGGYDPNKKRVVSFLKL